MTNLKRGDEISHSLVEAIEGSFKRSFYMYISKRNDIEGAFPRLEDVHIHSLAHPVSARSSHSSNNNIHLNQTFAYFSTFLRSISMPIRSLSQFMFIGLET